jgi:hypothetical protein
MTKQLNEAYVNALKVFTEARIHLTEATIAYDRERHTKRKELYDLKESGQRRMTEEQIRSESVVACKDVYADYTQALGAVEIAREHLEYIKAAIKDNQ